MSERVYNFQDILYLTYYSERDSLAIDTTWKYSHENAPFDLSKASYFTNRIDNIIQQGYKYNNESYITGIVFNNFKQTVQDATDNKNSWSLKTLIVLFESYPLSKFTSLIQVCSDGFFLDSTYAVISCLYTLCNGLSVPLVTESGFKLEFFTM